MDIIWSDGAREDIRQIYNHISQHNVKNALSVAFEIEQKIENLSDFPYMGTEGRVAGTRELYISKYPYVVVYRVSSNEIYIVAIFRGSQNYQ